MTTSIDRQEIFIHSFAAIISIGLSILTWQWLSTLTVPGAGQHQGMMVHIPLHGMILLTAVAAVVYFVVSLLSQLLVTLLLDLMIRWRDLLRAKFDKNGK